MHGIDHVHAIQLAWHKRIKVHGREENFSFLLLVVASLGLVTELTVDLELRGCGCGTINNDGCGYATAP